MLNAENFSVTHEQHDEDSTRLWCKLLVFAFIFVVWKVERFAWDLRSSTHFSRAQVSFTIMSYSLSFWLRSIARVFECLTMQCRLWQAPLVRAAIALTGTLCWVKSTTMLNVANVLNLQHHQHRRRDIADIQTRSTLERASSSRTESSCRCVGCSTQHYFHMRNSWVFNVETTIKLELSRERERDRRRIL